MTNKQIQKIYAVLRYFHNHRLPACSCHVTYAFQSESTLYSCLNYKQLFARSRCEIWSFSQMIELCSEYLSVQCIWLYVLVMSHTRFRVYPHSVVAWMSSNSLLEAGVKSEVLSDCKWTRTLKHLVHKQILNHLAKLVKWWSCVLSTYLYGAFDCMFLSCHIHVLEWIHIL